MEEGDKGKGNTLPGGAQTHRSTAGFVASANAAHAAFTEAPHVSQFIMNPVLSIWQDNLNGDPAGRSSATTVPHVLLEPGLPVLGASGGPQGSSRKGSGSPRTWSLVGMEVLRKDCWGVAPVEAGKLWRRVRRKGIKMDV